MTGNNKKVPQGKIISMVALFLIIGAVVIIGAVFLAIRIIGDSSSENYNHQDVPAFALPPVQLPPITEIESSPEPPQETGADEYEPMDVPIQITDTNGTEQALPTPMPTTESQQTVTPPPTRTPRQPTTTVNYQLAMDFLSQMTPMHTGVVSNWGGWGENLIFYPPPDDGFWRFVPLNFVSEVPYILWNSDWERPRFHGFFDRYGNKITDALYINDIWVTIDFQLFDLDNDGIPEILVAWNQFAVNGAIPFSLFRYVNGQYREMRQIEIGSNFLDEEWGWLILGGNYRFYTDTEGRLILYASGLVGGFIGFLTLYGEEARFEFIDTWFEYPPPFFHTLTHIPNLSDMEAIIRTTLRHTVN